MSFDFTLAADDSIIKQARSDQRADDDKWHHVVAMYDAAASQILVSEAVQRRVRGAVELRFEGERQLSGREEPVHVYSVDLGGRQSAAARREGAART